MDHSINASLEDELQCSICLDVLTDPVSTPCGHNFCSACIEQCWTSSKDHHCPLCKEKYTTKPELKVNTTFRAVVHHFQRRQSCSRPAVPCDVCSGRKRPAVKSCLDCATAYCESHLENHATAPRLKKHKLMDPVENLQDYICQNHERPLELFCRDDQTCVCRFCTETDHKTHSTVPVEQESGEKKRFNQCSCVLGKEGFSSGRFYYEVQVRGKTEWSLGVIRESSNRKGKITARPGNGLWAIYLRNESEYTARDSPPVLLSLNQVLQKVGVFVDYEEGLVSFYDVEASSHIYSFTGQSFTEKIYPFFFPCNKGESSRPMTICTFRRRI
uniref:E3 ubiquitin-protein ligase TRIM39-like n=1 Tax=Astyanax mexicanus TaxID=7994 RepID=A0A8B9GQ61_ASTMX